MIVLKTGYPDIKEIELPTGDPELARLLFESLRFQQDPDGHFHLPGNVLGIKFIQGEPVNDPVNIKLGFNNPDDAKQQITRWCDAQNLSFYIDGDKLIITQLVPINIVIGEKL